MHTLKCDICKKLIKGEHLRIEHDHPAAFVYHNLHICRSCGAPVIRFLKQKRLLQAKDTPRKKR